MQAITFDQAGGPEVLQLHTDLAQPHAQPGQLVVRNLFAGINYIDTYFRSGIYPTKLPGSTLGHEASGEVVEVGECVKGFQVGDTVAYLASQNAYAQYSATAAIHAVKLDTSKVTAETAAAALLQGLTAHTLVTRSYAVKQGDWVLVQAGAGGTGRLLVQMCKQLGANVIATISTDAKAQVARQAGADHTIKYTEHSVPEMVKQIVPDGVHVVFDGVGKATFQGSLESLRLLGTMVSFGNSSGVVPPVNMSDLTSKNLCLLRPRLYGYLQNDSDRQWHMQELMAMLETGKLDIQVFKIYTLADVAQAHWDLESRKTTGKLLLEIPK